jgi:hypothetical protein
LVELLVERKAEKKVFLKELLMVDLKVFDMAEK